MAQARELPRAPQLAVLSLGAILVATVALSAAHGFLGLGSGVLYDDILDVVAAVVAALACVLRAWLVREDRTAWLVLGVALGLFACGSLLWAFWLEQVEDPPIPSVVDALWLAIYPAAYATMGLLLSLGRYRFGLSAWLDGLIASLAVSAVAAALIEEAVDEALAATSPAAVVTALAYPLGDVVLLGFVVGALALTGWRAQWLLMGGGFAAFAAADIAYVSQVASGDLASQGLINLGWTAGAAALGLAAWQRRDVRRGRFDGSPTLAVPLLFTLVATGVLVYDHFERMAFAAIVLAASALGVGAVRTALTFREVRQLADSRREALTDELTGLSNRRDFFKRLETAIATGEIRLGVLVLDLDDFKELNDTLGHYAGDLLLQEVARRLPRCLRSQDTLARLGGDEFAVVLTGADGPDALAAAARVRSALSRPYELEGIQLALDASVGIALYPDDARTATALVQHADVAMYQAKASRSGMEVYDVQRDARSRQRLALSGAFRRAIDAGDLVLHYQPICDPRTGQPVATEALVRWEHRERGLLLPAEFLDLAERARAMRELTVWVVRTATAQARRWRDASMPLRVSVNLSPQNLLDLRFADAVADALDAWRLPPGALSFEITEDTIMADPVRGMHVLRDLGDLGVSMALDDFGTGWSSLAHLRRMPVDELKIDRSFVSRMTENHDDAVIVRSTVELARNLRLRVVAEGVEDLATWAYLSDLGCDLIQGCGVSPPLPAAEATVWLASRAEAMQPSP